jgi:PEP-CTERM motif
MRIRYGRALCAAVLMLSAAGRASADVITFRFDLTVTSLTVNPGDVIHPFMQSNFAPGQDLEMLVSWDDATPGTPFGTSMQFQGAITDVRFQTETYASQRQAFDYNFMFSPADGSSIYAYADLFDVPGEPMLPFEPYYFEVLAQFGPGALPPHTIPNALPSTPLDGYAFIAFGTDYYENPQFVNASIGSIKSVPEPGTLTLMALGVLGSALTLSRYRRR